MRHRGHVRGHQLSPKLKLMGPKAESTIMSQKSRANNLIVLVEFLLKFTSNKGFQLFLGILSNFTPKKITRIELAFKIEVVNTGASFFFQ